MLGFQRRLVRRWECDTDMPKPGALPQTSHLLATGTLQEFDVDRLSPTALQNRRLAYRPAADAMQPPGCQGALRQRRYWWIAASG